MYVTYRYSTMPPAVQWGIDNEERARQDYIKLMRKVNDVSIQPLGFTIMSIHWSLWRSSMTKVCLKAARKVYLK